MHLKHALAIVVTSTVLVSGVNAQDSTNIPANSAELTLFEPVETSATQNGRSPTRPSRESRVTASEPEFTLVGISRLGEQVSAMVRHRDGETLRVKAVQGANTPITGHPDYSIVDIQSTSVSIRFPQNNSCSEFLDRGVRCNAGANIAELQLATAEPLSTNNAATLGSLQTTNAEDESGTPEAGTANPFEALREAQRTNAAADTGNPAGGQFTPRRIDPADVPEGMRVIATPFGDRLVEQ